MAGQRVAVITGASTGIGEAIARELAPAGWHCVLLARRVDLLERVAEQVQGEWEACDVGNRAQVDEVAARVLERHPRIDLLRHKSLTVGKSYGFEPVIHTPRLLDEVRADWRAATPFVEWVCDHAGED